MGMIRKASDLAKVRRDSFTNGVGGGFATHALPPGEKLQGSRFQMVSQIEMDPGSSIGSHLHGENEEIYWILSGEGLYSEDGLEVPAGPGDVLIAQQGHSHGLKNTGAGPLVMIAVIAADRNP
jgi:mannose-6-phosphate isomerase-like protein (cupin superfamily)